MSRVQRLALVEPQAPDISLRRQCQLLGISRSSVYYQRSYDLQLMRQMGLQAVYPKPCTSRPREGHRI